MRIHNSNENDICYECQEYHSHLIEISDPFLLCVNCLNKMLEILKDTEPPEENEEPVKILGPYRGATYYLIVNGCVVPHIELFKTPGTKEETDKRFEWTVLVDKRFSAYVTTDDLLGDWGFIVAQAMAIAAGYTHHGVGSAKANPFTMEYVMSDTGDDRLGF